VWFKTRVGLVCIEGTAEFLAERWSLPSVGKYIGVFAYQARHPETVRKRLFRKAEYANRKIYLACIPDDGNDNEVMECMQRIEEAVRTGTICDLSDIGAVGAWNNPGYGVMVNWSGHDPLPER